MHDTIALTGLVLGSAVASSTPVLLATTGEILSQRSGIINLGLEGSMLVGAVTAAAVQLSTGNATLSVLAALTTSAFVGLVHAALVLWGNISMLASGLCLFFVCRGLSAFWGHALVGKPFAGLSPLAIPLMVDIPVLGDALFRHDFLGYLSIAMAVGVWWLLFRTRTGLRIRATGEDTTIARAEGVPTTRLQLACTAAGSALAGLGGAHIVLGFAHTWVEAVTAGRGWVAIGLVVLARWNPLYGLLAAYLFGGVVAVQLHAQAAGIAISPYILSALPYLVTLVALVVASVWAKGSGIPAELTRDRSSMTS
jgi:ABC-type uncharacterized transport system permease subunit